VKQSKQVAATHEAGHALAVLRSPLRKHIVQTRVYLQNDEWLGETEVGGERGEVDPNGVYEFAKGLAGPLTQLHFYPDSVAEDLADVLRCTGGLLHAARYVIEKDLKIESNWWGDVEDWNQYCLRCLRDERPIHGSNCLEVEKELNSFLKHGTVEAVVQDLAARLTKED